jgi:Uma2 family endonuclease
MATGLEPPVTTESGSDGALLHHISWSTYEALLKDYEEVPNPHFIYDRGDLLITPLSAEHENLKDHFLVLITLLAEEFEKENQSFGSMTHKREDLQRGFEPDACFYFQNEAQMRGKKRFDPMVDPPPELVIEIDISHPSLNKLPLFASFGIAEVWRWDGKKIHVLKLFQGEYVTSDYSVSLPAVNRAILSEFVNESFELGRLEWIKKIRSWAKHQRESHR